LHLTGDPGGSFDTVHTPDADAVGSEHVDDDRKHLVVVGHPKVLAPLVVAHNPDFGRETYNFCENRRCRESSIVIIYIQ